MNQAQHEAQQWERLLPHFDRAIYPALVADTGRDIRRLRVDNDLWAAYEEIVGNGGRSADLKAYIEWRVDNPTTPLPGRRRGPVKRVRAVKPPAEASPSDADTT